MEEQIYIVVNNLVTVIRKNSDIFRVAFIELPFEVSGVSEMRGKRINMIRKLLGEKLFESLKIHKQAETYMPIIGPAIITMIFSHFIIGPALKNALDGKIRLYHFTRSG